MARSKRKEKWFNSNGCYNYSNQKQQDELDSLTKQFRDILRPLESRVSYRDLFDIARDIASNAVGGLLRDHVNSKPIVKRKVKPKRKR